MMINNIADIYTLVHTTSCLSLSYIRTYCESSRAAINYTMETFISQLVGILLPIAFTSALEWESALIATKYFNKMFPASYVRQMCLPHPLRKTACIDTRVRLEEFFTWHIDRIYMIWYYYIIIYVIFI